MTPEQFEDLFQKYTEAADVLSSIQERMRAKLPPHEHYSPYEEVNDDEKRLFDEVVNTYKNLWDCYLFYFREYHKK